MQILQNPEGNYIYVIGDIMLDHYIHGDCNRISPEAPVQVVDIKYENYTLGGAGNVVKNLVAFGVNTGIISVCGQDNGKEIILKELKKLNVSNYTIIEDCKRPTTIKTRVISSKHQLIRLDRESKKQVDEVINKQIITALKEKLSDINILIISDYCKGSLNEKTISSIIDLCRTQGIKVVVDSKDPQISKYKNADIIKPNKREASIASGIEIIDDETLERACKKIVEITNCEAVVITLSEEGMAIFHDTVLTKVPTQALEIFDVTGAGDTVISALAFGLFSKLNLLEACDFANSAAAIVVAKAGSATATLDEINKHKLSQNK